MLYLDHVYSAYVDIPVVSYKRAVFPWRRPVLTLAIGAARHKPLRPPSSPVSPGWSSLPRPGRGASGDHRALRTSGRQGTT